MRKILVECQLKQLEKLVCFWCHFKLLINSLDFFRFCVIWPFNFFPSNHFLICHPSSKFETFFTNKNFHHSPLKSIYVSLVPVVERRLANVSGRKFFFYDFHRFLLSLNNRLMCNILLECQFHLTTFTSSISLRFLHESRKWSRSRARYVFPIYSFMYFTGARF